MTLNKTLVTVWFMKNPKIQKKKKKKKERKVYIQTIYIEFFS